MMTTGTKKKKAERVALSRKEFSDALGVAPSTVNRWTEDGTVKTFKIGSRVFIPLTEIEKHLPEGE